MPLEGHWARQNSAFIPGTRRESRALVIIAAVAALLVLTVAAALVTGSQPAPAPGCERVVVATSTGGASIERCPDNH
jgi:hypothetical protein